LLDRYDIINKAILCDPSFDARSMEWFRNNVGRLRVVADKKWDARSYGVYKEPKAESMKATMEDIVPRVESMNFMNCMNFMDTMTEPDELWARPLSPATSLTSSADSVILPPLDCPPLFPVPAMPTLFAPPPMSMDAVMRLADQVVAVAQNNAVYYGHFRDCGHIMI